MSRSERYIAPSDEELEGLRRAREAKEQCDKQRQQLLRAAFKKMKKADLVELALRVGQEHKPSEWMLEHGVGLDKPTDLLVNDIGFAIEIATQPDDPQLNRNPEIDWRAYEAVERGFSQLIQKKKIEEVKTLALRLIKKGGYQMECSDEGLMQEDIENCLRPVIAAVAESSNDRGWALRMLQHDVIGCICERELTALAGATPDN